MKNVVSDIIIGIYDS